MTLVLAGCARTGVTGDSTITLPPAVEANDAGSAETTATLAPTTTTLVPTTTAIASEPDSPSTDEQEVEELEQVLDDIAQMVGGVEDELDDPGPSIP